MGKDNKKNIKRYFDELGINEEEICNAVEILDCSSGARHNNPWNAGVKEKRHDGTLQWSDQVKIWRNMYNKLMVIGNEKGIMHDYTAKEDQERYNRWAGANGNDNGLLITGTVKRIGNRAFEKCPSLTSITIKYGVIWIGDEAFSGCCGVTSITIPASVTEIGVAAFSRCDNLTDVVFCIGEKIPEIGDDAFPQKTTLYVPKKKDIKTGLKNNKICVRGWKKYEKQIQEY